MKSQSSHSVRMTKSDFKFSFYTVTRLVFVLRALRCSFGQVNLKRSQDLLNGYSTAHRQEAQACVNGVITEVTLRELRNMHRQFFFPLKN